MDVFRRITFAAAADFGCVSASRCIGNEQSAAQLQQIALDDPELAEYYTRLAAIVPALQVQRAMEDLELETAAARIERHRAA